jgi:membrane-associated protease RseP (regulator of RpoE activity)
VGKNAYDPRGMTMDRAKEATFDFNLFTAFTVPEELRRLGLDRHSLTADPQFIAPTTGDYRVQPGSPAERIGFANFPMDRFGVVSPSLKARAKSWSGLGRAFGTTDDGATTAPLHQWLGATLRDLVNRGRESAVVSNMELSDDRGILIKAVAPESPAALATIPADAVIVAANDVSIVNLAALSSVVREAGPNPIRLKILTATGHIEVTIAAAAAIPQLDASSAASTETRRSKPARKVRPTQP